MQCNLCYNIAPVLHARAKGEERCESHKRRVKEPVFEVLEEGPIENTYLSYGRWDQLREKNYLLIKVVVLISILLLIKVRGCAFRPVS